MIFYYLVPFLVLLVKILDLVYFMQIKEYRFDRANAAFHDIGFFRRVYAPSVRNPSITPRNVLVVLIAIAAGFSTLYLLALIQFLKVSYMVLFSTDAGLHVPLNILAIVADIIIAPAVAYAAVSFAVFVTEPIAQYKRRRLITQATEKVKGSKTRFIGISGTYGKSTTKEYLAHILGANYKVGKTDENMNTDVGVAVSILKNLQPDTEYFVAEVGAYKLGEVRRAAQIFNPRAAIMLPFGNQHLDLFGSKENLVTSESEILEFVPVDGKVYANLDIPEFEYIKSHTKSGLATYSINNKDADIYADAIETTEKGSSARVHYGGRPFTIHTKLLGKHVIQNLLPAVAAAIDAKMTRDQVAKAVETIGHIPGKLSVHRGPQGSVVVNDTGNTSLHGFLAAIDTIKLFKKPEIYILSKGIIELGSDKKESYNKIIVQINKDNIGLATTDKLFKQFDTKNNITIVRNEDEMYKHIVSKLNNNSVLLLEGKFTQKFISKFI